MMSVVCTESLVDMVGRCLVRSLIINLLFDFTCLLNNYYQTTI